MLDRLVTRARALLEHLHRTDGVGPAPWWVGGHRGLMAAVKAVVVVGIAEHAARGTTPTERDLAAATRWLTRLEELQTPSGLFASGDNLASPPDTSFTLNDAAHVLALLRAAPDVLPLEVGARVESLLRAAAPAVTTGGVHTPNHRWEIASALAGIGHLLGGDVADRAFARARQWLAEGIDQDADGLYSERSATYAAYVSNPALLTLGDVLSRPDLVADVHTNLHAVLDLTTPAGRTETVHSRRQDQHDLDHPLGPFLAQLARFAAQCERCRAATRLAAETDAVDPVGVVAAAMLDDDVAAGLEAAGGADRGEHHDRGERLFAAVPLWRQWDGQDWTVLHAGSDVPRTGRIASGLAANPTFLRFARGGVVVASLRLSRDFFGLGPFRATGLDVGDGTVTLTEDVCAAYYQPLAAQYLRRDGDYALELEGRFAASMAFSERQRDEQRLTTRIVVDVAPDGVELAITTEGAATGHVLEAAFAPGVVMEGAQALGAGAHRMVGTDAVATAGDARLGVRVDPEPDLALSARYSPGEAYEFLGGTDALAGTRLAVAWSSPGVQRVAFRVG